MENSERPLSRRNDIVEQEVGNELLIYDLSADKAYCLNEISARVWRRCDGARSMAEIAEMFGSEDIACLAVEQLNEQNLLAQAPVTSGRFAGMTRRQMILKAGGASMVAIPVIATLAIPHSIYAQTSLLPIGSPCTTSSECTPNNQSLQCCRAGVCANGSGGCAVP